MTTRAGVILAGGRASRVGGADKALFEVGGSTLLARAVAALRSCDEIIIVGPEADRPAFDGARWVREDPPFAGPVAGIARAVAAVEGASEVIVLPADLPGAAEAVGLLLAAGLGDDDGVVLTDPGGYPQWLTARYRVPALAAAIDALEASASVRAVVSRLRVRMVEAPASATRDIDTWGDLARETRNTMSEHAPLPPEALDDWVAAACAEVGPDPADVDIAQILDLARDVAHGVARPAAPVTAYIAGLAAGRSGDADDAAEILARLSALASRA
ncbi:molybdenum cofactor guanylyltransferase [Microbacterium sorbitolivorans]|uniref:Molybdenum cofactor guanylyltransferase n=1 Tax=Microbacterium sorbitolivorans TaxID=1867410 RepID=A0A367Y1K8_9MICO|nr:NTP transferase domain-containing protein [Microbacterium sorbitolivorans]RCK59765.1 molybdenum cofactor guanylyltransferase [Microbacterium sorbitolivorans]GGF39771.1 molybdenum cofactor guanylyltransferase [Microbacterium sorbitolivorans]